MSAPIDGKGVQSEIDCGKMGACCDAGLAQNLCRQPPAEPGRVRKTESSFQASRVTIAYRTAGKSRVCL